jgi:hypothetical protein
MAIYGEVSKIQTPPPTRSSSMPLNSVSPAEVSIPLLIMTASLVFLAITLGIIERHGSRRKSFPGVAVVQEFLSDLWDG